MPNDTLSDLRADLIKALNDWKYAGGNAGAVVFCIERLVQESVRELVQKHTS